MNKWVLQKELADLCAECTTLKPSTARKYARDLFNKFDGKGISCYPEKEFEDERSKTNALAKALSAIKRGKIEAENQVLMLEEIGRVDFEGGAIIITTKNNTVHRHGEVFEYLKYVFKDNNYYY